MNREDRMTKPLLPLTKLIKVEFNSLGERCGHHEVRAGEVDHTPWNTVEIPVNVQFRLDSLTRGVDHYRRRYKRILDELVLPEMPPLGRIREGKG